MKAISIRSLVYIALFSALFIVFSAVSIKLSYSPVPFTLQTLAVILAGIFLKPRNAFLSIIIVIILGLIGLPVFGGKSGLAHILGPTGGFIFSFAIGALLISYLTQYGLSLKFSKFPKLLSILYFLFVFLIFGLVFPYVIGVPWFMMVLDMGLNKALTLSCYPYLLTDFFKIIVAVLVVTILRKTVTTFRFQQN